MGIVRHIALFFCAVCLAKPAKCCIEGTIWSDELFVGVLDHPKRIILLVLIHIIGIYNNTCIAQKWVHKHKGEMYKLIHTTLPVAGKEVRSSSRPMTIEFITVGTSIVLLLNIRACKIVKAAVLNVPLSLSYTSYYIYWNIVSLSFIILYCAMEYSSSMSSEGITCFCKVCSCIQNNK